MATGSVETTFNAPAGYSYVTLSGSVLTDGNFTVQPVAGDQILFPDTINVSAQLDLTGPDGTYTIYHIQQDGTHRDEEYTLLDATEPNEVGIVETTFTAGTLYTTVTLVDPIDPYLFEHWSRLPVAGEQLTTLTAEGEFDENGNYTTDFEAVHDVWFTELNGTIHGLSIDTTGLDLSDNPPTWGSQPNPPVVSVNEPGSYNVAALVSGENSITLEGTLPSGYTFDGTHLNWDGTTASDVYSGLRFLATNEGGSTYSNYFSIAVLTETGCLLAPPLPNPTGDIVNVSTVSGLVNALNNAVSGQTILLADGDYDISQANPAINTPNVTIRGDSDTCDAVNIIGAGMDTDNGTQVYGIYVNAAGITIANMTIRDTWSSSIQLNYGSHSPHIYNVRMFNAGEQFIKGPSGGTLGDGNDDGRVEYCIMEYQNTPPTVDHGGGIGYTNGVDIHGGENWVIRKNVIKNIHNPDTADTLWAPAILMWNGASGTITEQNLIINCDRAIAYGLANRSNDHYGGLIRNNIVVMDDGLFSTLRKDAADAAIICWDSPTTRVAHNTVMVNGNHPYAFEFRWGTGAELTNNLADAGVNYRDGASATESGNEFAAVSGMFVDAEGRDFNLSSELTLVTKPAYILNDYNGRARNINTDPGAVQYAAFSGADDEPNQFSFLDRTNQTRNSLVTSNTITVLGIDPGVSISASVTGADGEYRVSTDAGVTWGAWTQATTPVELGYQIQVRHKTAITYAASRSTTLFLNDVWDDFVTTTEGEGAGIVGILGVNTDDRVTPGETFYILLNTTALKPGEAFRAWITYEGIDYWLAVHGYTGGNLEVTIPDNIPLIPEGSSVLTVEKVFVGPDNG